MAQVTSVTVNLTKLLALQAGAQAKANMVIRKVALDVEAYAKSVVPVDTGNLKNSLDAFQRDRLLWWVATNVEYAAFVEFGTSRMHARPYLTPAVERVRPVFNEAFKVIFDL